MEKKPEIYICIKKIESGQKKNLVHGRKKENLKQKKKTYGLSCFQISLVTGLHGNGP